MTKTGILLVNLGTPDAPTRSAVYRYLKQFLLDPRVIDISAIARNILVRGIIAPFRSGESSKLYKRLWTDEGSPLKYYGERVAAQLNDLLPDEIEVRLAMRYQSPSIENGLNYFKKLNVEKLVILPLFPQYASATTGSVHEEVMRNLSKWQSIPDLSFISAYNNHPEMVKIYADNAREIGLDNYDHFVFSFHGIPQRQLRKADVCNHCLVNSDCCEKISERNRWCYSAQCYETAELIAKELNLSLDQYTVSFQSRLGRDPWTQPYTLPILLERLEKGEKNILVFSPAFVADCLETTIEIGYEYHEEFMEAGGGKLDLVPSLNDNLAWINFLSNLIAKQS